MSDKTELFVDEFIPADGWVDAKYGPQRQAEVQSLQDSVAIYLALGGTITQVPIGQTSEYDPLVASVPVFSGKAILTHPAKAKHLDLVKQVNHWQTLNPGITFKGLSDVMKIRTSTLNKVIKQYFAGTEFGDRMATEYNDRGLRQVLERVPVEVKDPSGNLKTVIEILRKEPDIGPVELAERIGRCYSYTYRLFCKAKALPEGGAAARRRQERADKIRVEFARHPGITLNQLALAIDATIEATKRVLSTELANDERAKFLLLDKRIRANRNPEQPKVWVMAATQETQ